METNLSKTFVIIHKNYDVGNISKYVMGNFNNVEEANQLAEDLNLKYFLELEKEIVSESDTTNQYMVYDVDHLLESISKKYSEDCGD